MVRTPSPEELWRWFHDAESAQIEEIPLGPGAKMLLTKKEVFAASRRVCGFFWFLRRQRHEEVARFIFLWTVLMTVSRDLSRPHESLPENVRECMASFNVPVVTTKSDHPVVNQAREMGLPPKVLRRLVKMLNRIGKMVSEQGT